MSVAHGNIINIATNQSLESVTQFGGEIYSITANNSFLNRNIVYASNGTFFDDNNQFQIWDVTDPLMPNLVGTKNLPYDGVGKIVISGQYAHAFVYPPDGGNTQVQILDISQPTEIVALGVYPGHWNLRGIIVRGNYSYLTSLSNGISVFDISDPNSPRHIMDIEPAGDAFINDYSELLFMGDYGYLASGENGLYVLDFTNPILPTTINLYPSIIGGSYADMTIWNQHLFFASRGTLHVYDLVDPVEPVEIATHENIGPGSKITVVDGTAYIANKDWSEGKVEEGVLIIDVSDPANPVDKGFYALPDAIDVSYGNGRIYVSAGTSGVYGFDILLDKTEAIIPATEGTLSSSDGRTTFLFPSGAFSETTKLTYRQWKQDIATGSLAGIGQRFGITAVYSNTNQPAELVPGAIFTITTHYEATGAAIENRLALHSWNTGGWIPVPSSVLDMGNRRVTAVSDQMNTWSLFGETNYTYLPVLAHHN